VAALLVMQKGKALQFCASLNEKKNSVPQVLSEDSFINLWPPCRLPHVQKY
jgi:hypothetical protein